MRMTNQAKPTVKWLRDLTRREWKRMHGYDPVLPASWSVERTTKVQKYGEFVR